jgi:hypothetical protein
VRGVRIALVKLVKLVVTTEHASRRFGARGPRELRGGLRLSKVSSSKASSKASGKASSKLGSSAED